MGKKLPSTKGKKHQPAQRKPIGVDFQQTLSILKCLCLNVSSCYSNEKYVALMTHLMQNFTIKLNFE